MSWLLNLDKAIAIGMNAHAHRSEFLDRLAVHISEDNFIKGAIISAIFVWLWFAPEPHRGVYRPKLVTVCAGAALAAALSRLLQHALPFRPRPIYDPALHLTLPYKLDPEGFAHMNSFPSDHAVLFGAIAAGLFWISKPAGLFASFWTLVMILMPRVFLGMHFLTDIVAGLAFGVLIMMLAVRFDPYLGRFTRFLLKLEAVRPSLFYSIGLLSIWQLTTVFNEVRAALRIAIEVLQRGP